MPHVRRKTDALHWQYQHPTAVRPDPIFALHAFPIQLPHCPDYMVGARGDTPPAWNIRLSHLCGSIRGSVCAVLQVFLSAEGCGCLAEGRPEGLRFDCGQYCSFTVFAVHFRFHVARMRFVVDF